MLRRLTLAIVVAGLVSPATAMAGGWATVGLSSTPDGLAPGEPWVVEIEVLQHGQTPLEGVQPKVTITEVGGGGKLSVAGEPTGRPGIYRAELDFPRGGTWEYAVSDGFGQTHTYPPVRIGQGAGDASTAAGREPGDGSGGTWARLGIAVAAGLLAFGLAMAAQRRRRERAGAPALER